ncbi:MAG: hypothetical protein O2958_00400 [Gemmatimonadetes bacterium]|nr:hypothetical protein [Gemmatimonadota bacterium]MDA1102741.1 hypothetical protein [Gemmatimonadota bacterium]
MTADRATRPAGTLDLPHDIPCLAPSLSGLELHGGPSSGPFLVTGARGEVTGDRRSPGGTVTIDGIARLARFEGGHGVAANLTLFPGVARREFVGREGTWLESIVVAPALPFVVLQWGTQGGLAPRRIEFDLLTSDRSGRPEVGDRGLVSEDATGDGVAMAVSAEGTTIEVLEGTSGILRVVVRTAGVGPVSLVVAAGTPAERRAGFTAAAHLQGHTIRAAEGPASHGLTLATGVSEIDDGVAWARARLRHTIDRLTWGNSDSVASSERSIVSPLVFMTGLAAAAVGDREGTRHAFSASGIRDSAERSLLAARLASVFGDASHALRVARDRTEVNESARPGAGPQAELQALAGRALADGLRYSAPEALIAGLRRERGSSRGGALPMVGRKEASPTLAAWLASLLSGEPTSSSPSIGAAKIQAMRGTCGRFRTDPDTAWGDWRAALSAGLSGGPSGPGTWDTTDAGADSDSLTAVLLLALTQGLLGLEPDAPAGRIRIAPRLPSHINGFTVAGITLGDASIGMRYTRDGTTHQFVLTPDIAPVPPLVVFEPAVVGRIREIRIDGEAADLHVRRLGTSTVAPVQIPIDGVRTMEITTA